MWTPFRMEGRELEWEVTGTAPRYLHVRTRDGQFVVRATVLDDAYARDNGRLVLSAIAGPTVLGEEFPLGHLAAEWPYRLDGPGFELAKGGGHPHGVGPVADRPLGAPA